MIKIICYLFPAIIAVGFTEYIEQKRFTLKKWIYYYVLYILGINLIISGILSTFFDGAQIFLYYYDFNNLLIAKYLGFSMVLSIILPILFKFIKNNINFEFNIEKANKSENNNQKSGKKKNKK